MAKKIRVEVRRSTVRMAGKWFDDACARNEALAGKFMDDTLRFLRSLSKRTGPDVLTIEVDRIYAERFVRGWKEVFREMDPGLLVQFRPYLEKPKSGAAAIAELVALEKPKSGAAAIAELVAEMSARLRRTRGHPATNIDPVAFYLGYAERKALPRRRGKAGVADASLRSFAAEWGVDSKNTTHKLLKAGKAVLEGATALQAALPKGAEIPLFLTDPFAPEQWGVAAVVLPAGKSGD